MKSQEPCGKSPLLALLHLGKWKGWSSRLSGGRDGGDVNNQKGDRVEAAVVASAALPVESFTAPERKFMLELARNALQSVLSEHGQLPELCATDPAPRLTEKRACFVTLTKNGELRGCVGHIQPREPLCQAIAASARSAALSDPRFPPVAADEVDEISIEISVLTEPQPLSFTSPEDLLSQLQPREHGVVLQLGSHLATFLPQVWERVPDKVEFLNYLAQKAGCKASAWRDKDSSISIYHVESFHEN